MSMFKKAATINAPAPKAAAKSKKPQVEIKGAEQLAMIDALQKTLETLRETFEGEVKGAATKRFMDLITETGQRPESFDAIEGGAIVGVTLARKSKASALTEAHVELLRANGIEPIKTVTTAKLFGINPKYAEDEALLGKVEKALGKIVPEDFIVLQEEQSKFTCDDDTLNAAISKRVPFEVIQSMTNVTCRARLKDTNVEKILDFVCGLIGGSDAFGEAAVESKSVKLSIVKAA